MIFQKKRKNNLKKSEKIEKNSKKPDRKSIKQELKKQQTIQNAIFYDLMLRDGVCAVDDNGLYSSIFQFSDINYQMATDQTQQTIWAKYMEILNALSNELNLQLLIHNRIIDEDDFENNVLMDMQHDRLDYFRSEFNSIMRDKVSKGNNRIVTEKYMTYNVKEETLEKAKKTIEQYDTEFSRKFSELGCRTEKLNGSKRLELMYSILFPNEKMHFNYDNLQGYDTTKDCIAPSQLEFKADHFIVDGRYARILYLKDYSTELSDEMINLLTRLEYNLTIAFNIRAIPRGEDIALLKNRLAAMEGEVASAQAKGFARGYNPDLNVSLELRRSQQEAEMQLGDVQERNQRLFECQFLVMINAKDEQEMEELTKSIMIIAKNRTCQMDILRMQQKEGMNACLPIGYRVPYRNRSLTTSVCAIMMPFTSQELMDRKGPYYGLNSLTKNMILCDRTLLKNPTGWVFGVPGSGKSFACKREMMQVLLGSNKNDLVVIDPENEYRYLANILQGSVVNVDNKHNVHINALDGDFKSSDFISSKADFCQTFVSQIYCRQMDAEERSLIDRAVRNMYTKYLKESNDPMNPIKPQKPTLKTFKQTLEELGHEKAKAIATGIEMYVDGSYDLFAGQTNINVQNRFTIYNILDAEETIKPVAMLVILESLWNKIIENHAKGIRTWIWIDEIYMLLKYEYAAVFLYELFKRARKFGAVLTGITQNVEDLINSPTARTMLSNSEFIYMLSQSPSDQELIADLLHISEQQISALNNARKGSGVLYNGNNIIIPFDDDFPKGTKLYEALTSDFEERKKIEAGIRLE